MAQLAATVLLLIGRFSLAVVLSLPVGVAPPRAACWRQSQLVALGWCTGIGGQPSEFPGLNTGSEQQFN